jgi:hypothetical protein
MTPTPELSATTEATRLPDAIETASPTPVPATATPGPTDAPTVVTLTPSLTITFTITPTPSSTLTPTADVGGFSALVDLAGRVTVAPPDVRYGPATATALWAIGDQLAATARAAATATPAPGATLSPSGLGTLPPPPGSGGACSATPTGPLGALLASDPALAGQLGCATGSPSLVAGAVQPFERGLMIYRAPGITGQAGIIEALGNDGRFTRASDTWVSGVDPDSGGLTPPPGLVEPIRGFGKVWRNDAALATRLGWALLGEQGVTLTIQPFERGVALYVPTFNQVYLLIEEGGSAAGSWRQVTGSL